MVSIAQYGYAFAAGNATVTITATGYIGGCLGPSNLVATQLSDHSVQLTWDKGIGANNTIIRRAFGATPTAIEGTEVYNGNGTSSVDYINLTTLDTYVAWRAYTVCGDGSFSVGYSEATLTGGITVIYIAIFGLCLGMSLLAFRGRFLLWNIAASVSWIFLFMYIKANPMSGVTEGDPVHTVALLLPIVAAVAIMLVGLGREVTTQKDYSDGLSLRSTVSGFKFFGEKEEGARPKESAREKRDRDLDAYRQQVRSALRNRRGR